MLFLSQKAPPVYIIFICLGLLTLLQWPASYLIQTYSLTWGILLNEWIFVMGIPLLIIWRWKTPFSKIFPFKRMGGRSLFWVILMTLALVVIVDYLTFLSEKIFAPNPETMTLLDKIMEVPSFSEGAWRWFLICLTPAFCEEIFFRGFFQNTLAKHWGRNVSLWLTAASFALIHGLPWYWHLYFLLGFYLSWLMLQSGNLWFPVIAHLINNSWTFINHALGNKIPLDETWASRDSLVMIVCIVVFALSAFWFGETVKNTNGVSRLIKKD